MKKIISIKDKVLSVRGNREKYIIEGMPQIVHDEKMKISQEQLDNHKWLKNQLSTSSEEYIFNLPREILYEIEGKKIYIAHYPMNADRTFRKHIKIANPDENEEMFSGIDAEIYLYGHTHINIYNIKNDKFYINPGALGCPGKTDEAPYGILIIEDKKVEYQQLFVKYNVQEVIRNIENLKFPGYQGVLRLFFGKAE